MARKLKSVKAEPGLGTALISAALATALSLGIADIAHAQGATAKMPPVYGLRSDQGQERQLTTLETRVVNVALDWAEALNRFSYDGVVSGVSYPFYLEGRFISNNEDLGRYIRQWYVVNKLEDYQDKPWDVTSVSLVNNDVWINDPTGERDVKVLERLGIMKTGYTILLTMQNPDDRFDEVLQVFHIRLDGTTPKIACIWDYKPPLLQ